MQIVMQNITIINYDICLCKSNFTCFLTGICHIYGLHSSLSMFYVFYVYLYVKLWQWLVICPNFLDLELGLKLKLFAQVSVRFS